MHDRERDTMRIETNHVIIRDFERKDAVNALVDWCFSVSDVKYLILSIDCANIPSCRLAEKCDFELFEKRTPIGHKQSNMESDSYFYYRKYRCI